MPSIVGLSLALVLQAAAVPAAPYKVDDPWAFFRMEPGCMAVTLQPPSNEGVIMRYNATKKWFQVGFTKERASELGGGEGRLMDVRLHRPGGVLDDGWEDVAFFRDQLPDGTTIFMSQPMADPAARDFNEMEAVVFIDHGKTAGFFKLKGTKGAVSELLACAKGQIGKR